MSFILYHLAKNPTKQDEVYREVKRLLPETFSPITRETLSELRYLKAAIKESFRLNPISIGVGRVLLEDTSFSGYNCPKNVMMDMYISLDNF